MHKNVTLFMIFWQAVTRAEVIMLYCHSDNNHTNTPCPEKNGTNNIFSITLTKFNKFSQFLAQFMLTCQLTKNYKKCHHYLYNTMY